VNVAARVVRCSHFEHLNEFFLGGSRAIGHAETDGEGALIES
jgi:hypothetical protein